DELGQLEAALQAIPDVLSPGGRAAAISFHSLEDRRIKWSFKTNPKLKVLTKKPVTATAEEVALNPRARSAKLRVVERCPDQSKLPRRQPGPSDGPQNGLGRWKPPLPLGRMRKPLPVHPAVRWSFGSCAGPRRSWLASFGPFSCSSSGFSSKIRAP